MATVATKKTDKAQRKLAIAGHIAAKKQPAVSAPKIIDTIDTIKREANLLADRLRQLDSKPVRTLHTKASAEQAADIARLAVIRASRKDLDVQEAEITARLRTAMDATGASQIASATGRYCYEPVAASVVVRPAGGRYILRT